MDRSTGQRRRRCTSEAARCDHGAISEGVRAMESVSTARPEALRWLAPHALFRFESWSRSVSPRRGSVGSPWMTLPKKPAYEQLSRPALCATVLPSFLAPWVASGSYCVRSARLKRGLALHDAGEGARDRGLRRRASSRAVCTFSGSTPVHSILSTWRSHSVASGTVRFSGVPLLRTPQSRTWRYRCFRSVNSVT